MNRVSRHSSARRYSLTALKELLSEGLGEYLGRPARVRAVEHEPLSSESTHPIERLRVHLDTGEVLPVIAKRLRPEEGDPSEVLIYRRLLAGSRFGAPRLYASVHDEAAGRYWLFLEDVGDWTLNDGDVGDWRAAVRWLAQMHGSYAGRADELRALGFLEEHGEGYYAALADDARAALATAGDQESLARFDRVMKRYDACVAFLAGQPRTFVHGDVFPHNIHLQAGGKVRPVDWEDAAVGLGSWDLARLLDGWGSDKPAFVRLYLDELERQASAPVDRAAVRREMRYGQMLNVLIHLGWDPDACRDAAYVRSLLDNLEEAMQAFDRGGRR